MTTLEDAWKWYSAAAANARRLKHLAKFWDDLPWGQQDGWVKRMERDDVLRHLNAFDLENDAKVATDEHDDLAVLVLFSVFEAIVRGVVQTQVEGEVATLRHPALKFAAKEAVSAIEEGSFFRVLEPYKSADSGLIEEVNQVRRYRNWVAHGRRGDPPGDPPIWIDPRTAYERLGRFLTVLIPPSSSPP